MIEVMENSEFEAFKHEVEQKLLFQLTLNIKDGKIAMEEGKEIASLYLALKPTTKEELIRALIEMEQAHPVVAPIVSKYVEEADKVEAATKLEQMHNHLAQGNIDGALAVGKGEA